MQYVLFRTYALNAAERLALVHLVYRMNSDRICAMNPATMAPVLAMPPSEAMDVLKSLEDQRYIKPYDKINGETFYEVVLHR